MLTTGVLFAGIVVSAWVERFFFYPDRVEYTSPAQFGLSAEDVWLTAPDGSRLHAWFLPAQGRAKGTVLHLHGNAANVSNHLPLVAWLPPRGFNVLTLDYRGFGRSQGTPSLDGIVDDAAAALEYLRRREGVDPTRLIVVGQSLGGATALRLLARDAKGVRLAVIDSAFASYRQIAREAASGGILAPVAPFVMRAFPGPEKDPITVLRSVHVPLIFVHGTRDAGHRARSQRAVACGGERAEGAVDRRRRRARRSFRRSRTVARAAGGGTRGRGTLTARCAV